MAALHNGEEQAEEQAAPRLVRREVEAFFHSTRIPVVMLPRCCGGVLRIKGSTEWSIEGSNSPRRNNNHDDDESPPFPRDAPSRRDSTARLRPVFILLAFSLSHSVLVLFSGLC